MCATEGLNALCINAILSARLPQNPALTLHQPCYRAKRTTKGWTNKTRGLLNGTSVVVYVLAPIPKIPCGYTQNTLRLYPK